MKKYFYKNKTSTTEQYVSNSQNCIVMILNTNVSIYNIKNNNTIKIKIDNVQDVCISNDDRFMLFSKIYSPYLYLYDLSNQKIILRKILKKTIIKFIHLDNRGNALIWLKDISIESQQQYYLYSFHYKDNSIQPIDYFNIYSVDHIYDTVYKIEYLDKNTNEKNIHYCEINNETIKKLNVLTNFDDHDCNFGFSKDKKYYFVAKNIIKDDLKLDEKNSNIILYQNEKEILKINDRKANTPLDILLNLYRGKFVIDTDGNHIFYTACNQKVYLYYLEKNINKEIEIGKPIFDYYISFKNDYLLINSSLVCYSNCYIYRLDELL